MKCAQYATKCTANRVPLAMRPTFQPVMLHVCWSGRKHDSVSKKRAPMPPSPQQIHQERPWKWTQVSAVLSQALHVVFQFWPMGNLAQHTHGPCCVVKWQQPVVCCFVRQFKWNASRRPFENSPGKNQKWPVSDLVKAPALRRQLQCSVTFHTLIKQGVTDMLRPTASPAIRPRL